MIKRTLMLAASMGMSACNSPAAHYYTLQDAAPSAPTRLAKPPFQFEMLGVHMPVQVDQPQLVVRQNRGNLVILENDRWSAPLADEFHDALTERLERHLGTRDIAGLPKDAQRPVLSLQADVRRFDSLPGQYALVDVVWSLGMRGDSQQRRTLTCASLIRETAGIELNSLVIAHQRVIDQLAAEIAITAGAWARGTGACPN
ncbi:membrane integrity-associated transporter subunit PqiC [Pseudomonas sp. FP2309]|uniref:PqiC family protein n=1 Tax=Pseudomonas sp. FP2309 TaxID=2954091 RepID=UPI002736A650|nr:PqiC family protein [Pseudomonas sp. FP2309]WLH66150.1 PqiC family protein [Pseudomonas sp. FP2309]